MDLRGYSSLSNWTSVNIQSDEPENTLMQVTIFCDELAFHETHVGLKRQCLAERTCSAATDSVQSYEAFEVRDL